MNKFYILFFVLISSQLFGQKISSIVPTVAAPGDTVELIGSGFNSTLSYNVVNFGGVDAQVLTSGTSRVTVIVPDGATSRPIHASQLQGAYSFTSHLSFICKVGQDINPDYSNRYNTFTSIDVPNWLSHDSRPGECFDVLDLDEDGDQDLVVATGYNPKVYSLLNNSTTSSVSFQSPTTLITTAIGAYGCDVEHGDFTGDGKMELFVSGVWDNGAQSTAAGGIIWQNNSSGTSLSFSQYGSTTSYPPLYMEVGDFHTARLDFISGYNRVDDGYQSVRLYKTYAGVVSGSFQVPSSASSTNYTNVNGIRISNLDKDSYLDRIVAGETEVVFEKLGNNGDLTLTRVAVSINGETQEIKMADFDGDGYEDVALATLSSDIEIIQNTCGSGSFSFSHQTHSTPNSANYSMDIYDMNMDSRPDIIVAGDDSILLYLNTSTSGNISFSAAPIFLGENPVPYELISNPYVQNHPVYRLKEIAVFDANGDGYPDIVGFDGFQSFYILPFNVTSTLSVSSSLTSFSSCLGGADDPQTINLSGSSLEGDVKILPLYGYEYSLDGINYYDSLILSAGSGTLSSTDVSVRLVGKTLGTISGDIRIASKNAVTQRISVTGTVTGSYPTGNTFNLDGDRIFIPSTDKLKLDGSKNFTLEAWIYPESFGTAGNPVSNTNAILDKTAYANNYALRCGGNGQLSMTINQGYSNRTVASADNALTLNTWQHVAATYNDVTKAMKLYVNGVLVKTDYNQNWGSVTFTLGNENLYIGDSPAYSNRFFDGNIDDVRIWNRDKTELEISRDRYGQIDINDSNLMAWYTFDHGVAGGSNVSVNYLTDIAHGANGTIYLANLSGSTSNWVESVIPNIEGTTTLAIGGTSTLTHSEAGGTWSISNSNVATINSSGLVTGVAQGTTEVTYSTATSCVSTTLTVEPIQWTGAVNDNWHESGNWNTNAVPTSTSDIEFPTSSGTVEITSANASARNMTVNSGTTLNITTGKSLSVSGILVNDGTIEVANSASLVQGSLSTLSSSGTASVFRETGVIASPGRFQYWSSPVSSTSMSSVFYDCNAADFYYFDEGAPGSIDGGWLSQSFSAAMTPGKGYITTGTMGSWGTNQTREFQSTSFNNGTVSLGIEGASDEYLLVGNPYPSAIDRDEFFNDNPGLTGSVYFWRHSTNPENGNVFGTNSANDYGVLNNAGWVAGGNPFFNNAQHPGNYIQATQGFFVQVSNGTNLSSVVFQNDQRVAGNNSNFFKSDNAKRFWLSVVNTNEDYNQILIAQDANATPGIDKGWDAPKLYGNPNVAFYSLDNDNQTYTIQALPESNNTVVSLGLDAYVTGAYTIALDSLMNWNSGAPVLLLDSMLGIYTDLTLGDYTFSVNWTGPIRDRFYLKLQTNTVGEADLIMARPITWYDNGSEIQFLLHDSQIGSRYRIANNLGQTVTEGKVVSSTIRLDHRGLQSGMYHFILDSSTEAVKFIVK